jgi:hypothetical protein
VLSATDAQRGSLSCSLPVMVERLPFRRWSPAQSRGFGFLGAPLYIRPMRERKRKRRPERRVATWQISRLRGTPAAFIGLVDAPDAASAKERAIKQFDIRPQDRDRLIAVRHQ